MKTTAYLVVALFALVTASCAAPANFINPTVEITPETCVVFQTCSATSSDAKDEFNKALLEGTWYKVGESDVANLMAQGLAFRYGGSIGNDGKVLCTKTRLPSDDPSKPREAPNVPKIIVFEFWDPTCPQKPKVCTKYNDNIIKVSSTGSDYIFVDGSGNSYFKGAGFYTSCEGPQTQTLTMTAVGGAKTTYTSTVEKVLVAGNSKEALNKTVTAIAKIVKGSFSLSRNEAGIRYQLDDGWATTAIVYFSEDKTTADLLKDKLTVGGKTPLMVDDTVNEGIIARYLLSPGKNKGQWYNIPWINEATASTVKVVASADVAFRTMATSGSTPSVPLMMFGELNSKNPGEKIVNSTIYGCKPAGEPLGTVERETDAGTEKTTMTSTGLTFTATEPYAIKDGALLVQHTDDADLYAGENGAICTFSGKEAGKCKAIIQENLKQQTQFKTGAKGAITSKKYCSEVGTDLKGNYLEYGVYSENKAAGGGTVYFMSGLAPCTTYGIANESDEYFTIFLAPDEAQYMPSCSKVMKNGQARCPYGYDHSYHNGKGIGWDQWCLCASVGTQPTWPTVPAFTPAAGGGQLPTGGGAAPLTACTGAYGTDGVLVCSGAQGEVGLGTVGNTKCCCKSGYEKFTLNTGLSTSAAPEVVASSRSLATSQDRCVPKVTVSGCQGKNTKGAYDFSCNKPPYTSADSCAKTALANYRNPHTVTTASGASGTYTYPNAELICCENILQESTIQATGTVVGWKCYVDVKQAATGPATERERQSGGAGLTPQQAADQKAARDSQAGGETDRLGVTPATAGADSDNDGLADSEESAAGTDPAKADSDGDGLTDYDEVKVTKTSPTKLDTDGDTIRDGEEVALSTDPLKPHEFSTGGTVTDLDAYAILGDITEDSDGNGIRDLVQNDLEKQGVGFSGGGDYDGDGLSDVREFAYGGKTGDSSDQGSYAQNGPTGRLNILITVLSGGEQVDGVVVTASTPKGETTGTTSSGQVSLLVPGILPTSILLSAEKSDDSGKKKVSYEYASVASIPEGGYTLSLA